MTDDEFKAQVARLAAEAPQAEKLPPRSDLDFRIDDTWRRMAMADDPESKMLWARRFVEAKRERGDYDKVIQPPISDELVDALARHEALAAVHNVEGERHD